MAIYRSLGRCSCINATISDFLITFFIDVFDENQSNGLFEDLSYLKLNSIIFFILFQNETIFDDFMSLIQGTQRPQAPILTYDGEDVADDPL